MLMNSFYKPYEPYKSKNHYFDLYSSVPGFFKCTKCNIKIITKPIDDEQYWINGGYVVREKDLLTCDEYIVKNIIE